VGNPFVSIASLTNLRPFACRHCLHEPKPFGDVNATAETGTGHVSTPAWSDGIWSG
jgi:hypothetical protein